MEEELRSHSMIGGAAMSLHSPWQIYSAAVMPSKEYKTLSHATQAMATALDQLKRGETASAQGTLSLAMTAFEGSLYDQGGWVRRGS